jgi:transcriptional regulator with XRE-family HTH domain
MAAAEPAPPVDIVDEMQITRNILAVMADRGVRTQRELAQKLGVTPGTLSKHLGGERQRGWPYALLRHIALILDVPMDAIVAESDQERREALIRSRCNLRGLPSQDIWEPPLPFPSWAPALEPIP